jgi:predicted HicB family RNase H-like nuclease
MVPPRGPVVVTDPDPTAAVTEALRLAVRTIEDKFADQKASIVLAREEMAEKLQALFAGINDRFTGNKELVDQLGQANATALTAALENQKELLTQLKVTFDGTISAVNEKIDAVNEKIDRLTSRLDTGDGRYTFDDARSRDFRQVVHDRQEEYASKWGIAIGLLGVAVAVIAIVFGHSH